MLSFILELLQRLVAFFDRRRGVALAAGAVLLSALSLGGVVAIRPPLLAPALEAVEHGLSVVLAQPGRLAGYFTSPRASQGELMRLQLELARLRELDDENRRLRSILAYEAPPRYRATPARVVGLDLDPVRGLAWIGAGSRDGIRGGEPVLTTDGLVGLVESAGGRRSRISLLRNLETPVGVRDTRSRVVGVLRWDPGEGVLRVDYVPKQADVAPGDTLVSSGLGGVFPPGLPVGEVSSVSDPPDRLLRDIAVRPFTSFFTLQEVFVLLPADAVADSGWAPAAPGAPEAPGVPGDGP